MPQSAFGDHAVGPGNRDQPPRAALVGSVTAPTRAGAALWATTHAVPQGPAYSLLLVLHVAAALVGFGAVAITGVQAARVRRGPSQPGAAGLRRYFRPGVNWAGRTLYAVPVLGFALLADSSGTFDAGDGWVVAGLGLWLAAATVAELVVWPGERRIQLLLSTRWDDAGAAPTLDRECRRVATASAALVGVFVAAVIIMVGEP